MRHGKVCVVICVITARTALCAAAVAATTPCATATQCTYLHERVRVRPKLRCTVLCGVATCCPALHPVVQCCNTAAHGPVRWAAMGPALLVHQGVLFMGERLHAGTQRAGGEVHASASRSFTRDSSGAVPVNALARRLALRATTPRGRPTLRHTIATKWCEGDAEDARRAGAPALVRRPSATTQRRSVGTS